MADFILNMPPHFFARVFGNPAGDPVLLESRGVTLLRDNHGVSFILMEIFATVGQTSVAPFCKDWPVLGPIVL